MTDDQLKQLAADILNGKTDPSTVPPGHAYYKIFIAMIRMDRQPIIKRMMEVSKERLESKGFVHLDGLGWKHRTDLPHLDLVKKNGRWFATDPRKTLPHQDDAIVGNE